MSINETECLYFDVIIITLQNDVSQQNKTMPNKGMIARLLTSWGWLQRFYDAVSLEDSDNPGKRGQQQTHRDTEIVRKKFQQIRAESCPEADDNLAVHC